MKYILFIITFLPTNSAFAECFKFQDGPFTFGPVDFSGYQAHQLCVQEDRSEDRIAYHLEFSDDYGVLAIFTSHTEEQLRCFDKLCRKYRLTSGQALGQRVYPDGTEVTINFDPQSKVGTAMIRYSIVTSIHSMYK